MMDKKTSDYRWKKKVEIAACVQPWQIIWLFLCESNFIVNIYLLIRTGSYPLPYKDQLIKIPSAKYINKLQANQHADVVINYRLINAQTSRYYLLDERDKGA